MEETGQNMYTTMSIASLGPSTFPRKAQHPSSRRDKEVDSLFYTESSTKRGPMLNKPNTQLLTTDIAGAQSKQLHYERRGYDSSYFTGFSSRSDIICPNGMATTQRHVNPLLPEYKLPSFQPTEPHEPKFLRDAFNVSDIDGARALVKKAFTVRDMLRLDDIEGANTTWRPKHE